MADNTTLPGTGQTIRDIDRSNVKTQVIGLDLNPGGAEQLMTAATGIPVDAVGTKVTAATIPTGGVGFLGWLTAIFWQLTQILNVKIDQTTPGTTNKVSIGNDGIVARNAATSGGWTPNHALTAASNNATSLKSSAGQVGGWVFSNTNASTRYVKFYNKASAPNPASDVPVFVIAVPGGTTASPTVVTSNDAIGLAFSTGIAYACVTGMSDSDNTSVTAGDMSIDIKYK